MLGLDIAGTAIVVAASQGAIEHRQLGIVARCQLKFETCHVLVYAQVKVICRVTCAWPQQVAAVTGDDRLGGM